MYIRKTTKTHKGKIYTNYLLVECLHTPKGTRQRIICSLGSLASAPREQWLSLAHRLESSLQGQSSLPPADPQIEALAEQERRGRRRRAEPGQVQQQAEAGLAVEADRVSVEEAREAGPVHAGHQMWQQLGLSEILSGAGLSDRACHRSEAMTLNRLVFPLSEHAMPGWRGRTALDDILGAKLSPLSDEALYRNLDRLHPNRQRIEAELAEREKTLFNLHDTVYLYELTSTYFEGEAANNSQAKRGYSRDKRPDAKQVLVGLVLDREGFPKAQEVFEGNRQDLTGDEIWRTYILLTRVEAAFRAMKSPLLERPIFPHLEKRTQTHIFLCVPAYHLLLAIGKRFLDRGMHTSWWTLRQHSVSCNIPC